MWPAEGASWLDDITHQCHLDFLSLSDCGVRPAVSVHPHRKKRILGGRVSRRGAWPWQCSLQSGQSGHVCGCVLIGRRWALTVAHCFEGWDEHTHRNWTSFPIILWVMWTGSSRWSLLMTTYYCFAVCVCVCVSSALQAAGGWGSDHLTVSVSVVLWHEDHHSQDALRRLRRRNCGLMHGNICSHMWTKDKLLLETKKLRQIIENE